jgi:hypothetical protein
MLSRRRFLVWLAVLAFGLATPGIGAEEELPKRMLGQFL